MTTVQGTLRDSGGNLITAKLRITLDGVITDTTTDPATTYVQVQVVEDIANGSLSVDLVESATSNTTYRFELYQESTSYNYFFLDGEPYLGPTHQHTDNLYYTGEQQTADSVQVERVPVVEETEIQDFRAVVPNQASVDWYELIPTGVTTDVLDTGIRRLAQVLTQNTTYANILKGGPFFQGEYDAATFYVLNDVVNYAGSSWIYINSTTTAGNTPAEGAYWSLLASKGDPGGTGGDDTAYDAVGWNGDTNAPSKNVVRDQIEAMLTTIATLATTTYVDDEIAAIEPASPVGTIVFWAHGAVPSRWLALDGTTATLSRTTYSELFTLWGATFGAGDGSTTFGIPNMSAEELETAPYTTGTWIVYTGVL